MNVINTTTRYGNYTEYQTQADWIVPMAVTSFLVVATLWILISLIFYGIKTNKWKKMNFNNYEKLNAGLVYTSVVICAVLCLVRLGINLVYMNVGFSEKRRNQLCNSLFDAMGVMYGMVILATYVFLWLRQRVFYVNRMLNIIYNNMVRLFSAFSIFVIVTCGVCVLIFSTIPNDHFSSPDGCIYKPDRRLFIGYYASIVLFIFVGNAVLFGLFTHGLRKANEVPPPFRSRGNQNSFDLNAESGESSRNKNMQYPTGTIVRMVNGRRSIRLVTHNTPVPTSDLVKTVLKKTFFFAVVSVACDISLQVLLYFTNVHRRTVTTLFNVNAFLNVLFIIFSFVQYKKMLFSPCYSKIN